MRWSIALVCVVLVFGSAFGGGDTDTTKKLVGVWELAKAEGKVPPGGATVEFTKDGKIMLRVKAGDKDIAFDGTYKVKDKAITTTIDFGGKSKTETGTIKSLTEKELVIVDEKGKVEEYKRKN